VLHPGVADQALVDAVLRAVGITEVPEVVPGWEPPWDNGTTVVITYADSIRRPGEVPLQTLRGFIRHELAGRVDTVHVLPFFPWSSDDGFAVIDHRAVDPALGTWGDVTRLGDEVDLMADLVVNHVSAASPWFEQFVSDREPGRRYLKTADPAADLSAVVRPRTHGLLRAVQTVNGERHLWCTFGPDQIDLDYDEPDVLCELLGTVDRLVSAGVRWLRLDAVAYVFKEVGTECIHLPRTHELVRLLRTLLAVRAPGTVVLTETNVPHEENLSYLGDGDEAHVVYNFSLPPLLVHGFLSESPTALRHWLASNEPTPTGTTLLNFIASHDGLGVRPVEGLLSDPEIDALASRAVASGGLVSYYATPTGERPYELNVSLFDLLGGPDGEVGVTRYLAAHTVMLAVRGVPAFYLHSLLGTPNDLEGVAARGISRAVNRRKLGVDELDSLLAADGGLRRGVLTELLRRIEVRGRLGALHPDSPQQVVDVGPGVFGVLRGAGSAWDPVLCLTNMTSDRVGLDTDLLATVLGGRPVDRLGEISAATDPRRLGPFQSTWLSASTAARS
jgi:sucrose phosphorylase